MALAKSVSPSEHQKQTGTRGWLDIDWIGITKQVGGATQIADRIKAIPALFPSQPQQEHAEQDEGKVDDL